MKLSVRRKVANGLVICLLAPKAVTMAAGGVESSDAGPQAFSARDDFDLAALSSGDASSRSQITVNEGLVADPCDPSGGADPSGFTTTCVDDPSGGLPTFCYKARDLLVTAEDGTSDLIEVWSGTDPDDPSGTHVYRVSSSDTSEATTDQSFVELDFNSCAKHSVWVTGENDGFVDGDQNYSIVFENEDEMVVGSRGGVNLDNDDYSGTAVNVHGPRRLPEGGSGQFDVLVENLMRGALPSSNLVIQPSAGLEIDSFAASIVGGGTFGATGRIQNGALVFNRFSLAANEVLLVTVQATLNSSGPGGEKMTATIVKRGRFSDQTDDDTSTDLGLP